MESIATQDFHKSTVISLEGFIMGMRAKGLIASHLLMPFYLHLIDQYGFNRIEAENFISLFEGIVFNQNRN